MTGGTRYQYKFEGKVGTDNNTNTDSMVTFSLGTNGFRLPMARLVLSKIVSILFLNRLQNAMV